MRRSFALLWLAALIFLPACGEKKNPNYEPPQPYDGRSVGTHRFDGAETDPYGKPDSGGGGGEGGGEAAKKE